MLDRRDRQKKRFIETLEAQGTVLYAAKGAGISRWTAYRWRQEDPEFDSRWDEAHRPIYRDRLNIDIEQVRGEIEERMEQLGESPALLPVRAVLQDHRVSIPFDILPSGEARPQNRVTKTRRDRNGKATCQSVKGGS